MPIDRGLFIRGNSIPVEPAKQALFPPDDSMQEAPAVDGVPSPRPYGDMMRAHNPGVTVSPVGSFGVRQFALKMEVAQKANPYHDKSGAFTSKEKATGGTEGASEGKAAVNAAMKLINSPDGLNWETNQGNIS